MQSRVKKVDDFLDVISKQLSFSRINPTNSQKALKGFKKDKKNPDFTYNPVNEHLSVMKGILQEISLGKTAEEKILDAKRIDIIRKITLLEKVDTPDFTKASLKLYGRPSKRIVEKAYYVLSEEGTTVSPKIKRQQAQRMFREAFKILGFTWRIKNEDMVASANVNAAKRTLALRKKERFSELYVRRLIVHEIGTHAVRGENARLQPLKVFVHGLHKYLETEEGLAAYCEDLAGLLNQQKLRNYAGRVVAVHYALDHSFKQTYAHLRKYFSDAAALKLTLRAKRGVADTSKPGAYTKDALYFSGYLKVKAYHKKNDLKDLFIGKIGIDDVKTVKKIPGIKPPKYLPFELIEKVNELK